MKLHEVILYVQNMDEQITFYRDVLGLSVTFPHELRNGDALHWVTFETGQCILALHSGGSRQFGTDAPRIVFIVDDLSEWRSKLINLGVWVGEPRSPAPGITLFDAADPEGNRFSLESVHQDS